MSNQQRCKVCGYPDKFNFNVPDDIWNAVVPVEYITRVVCLSCFDEFAHDRGIDYSGSLHSAYFVGRQVAFEFQVRRLGIIE